MDRDSVFPELKVTRMGGIDQRTSPDDLDGEGHPSFSVLEGMYPAQDGLLSRVPGKVLRAMLPGEIILNFAQPFDSTNNILVQTNQNLYAFTLDELQGRIYTPTITPSSGTEDESMSYAILSHLAANGTSGGALDAAAVVDTFYVRTLTTEEVDANGIVALAANAFTLQNGTYRINVACMFNPVDGGSAVVGTTIGLYNNTSAAFEVYSGTSEPILGTAGKASTGSNTEAANTLITLDAVFVVSGGAKAYTIRQKASVQAAARGTNFCGIHDQCTTNSNVNSAKSKNRYLLVKIWKE